MPTETSNTALSEHYSRRPRHIILQYELCERGLLTLQILPNVTTKLTRPGPGPRRRGSSNLATSTAAQSGRTPPSNRRGGTEITAASRERGPRTKTEGGRQDTEWETGPRQTRQRVRTDVRPTIRHGAFETKASTTTMRWLRTYVQASLACLPGLRPFYSEPCRLHSVIACSPCARKTKGMSAYHIAW